MNKFYRKASIETMKKNKELYEKNYSKEIEWFKSNLDEIKNNKFLMDMYIILITGSRKISEKMLDSIHKSMNNPMYDKIRKIERMETIKPIMEKINLIYNIVFETDKEKNQYYRDNFSALNFVESIKKQLESKGKLSEKQMLGLNKIYKRYTKKK
tara:strand:+ start:8134 stop:8598 length:465 start_codon:yes stop_codon:yes gene_type:complete